MSESMERNGRMLRELVSRAWARLEEALDRLDERGETAGEDVQGWRAADHLHHLAVWAEAALAVVDGRPRYETLEIGREQFDQSDFDALNEILRRRGPAPSLVGATARLRALHPRLTVALARLTDDELWRPCETFVSGDAGRDHGRSLLDLLYANTVHHVEEHLDWIESPAD